MKPSSETDITFYEELGVEPTATAEQIRETYRSLVRLLHPDQQTDAQLKSIAEAQMRKLNRIHAVLADPERRAQYNALLQGANAPPSLVMSEEAAMKLRKWTRRGALLLAGGAIVGGVLWTTGGAVRDLQEDPAGAREKQVSARSTGSTATDQADEITQLRAEVRSLETERNRALEELARLRGSASPRRDAATLTDLPSADNPANKLPTLAETAPPRSTFGGTWYWTRSMQPSSDLRGSYQPEFIEATLTEVNGVIKGTYRARYRVQDAGVNPDVSFEFAATLAGPILICPWTGPGGARGEVMVRQTSRDSLQLDWTAHELGVRQRVSTGSAVLARKSG
jgi:curved DNA-binding protein CbpA